MNKAFGIHAARTILQFNPSIAETVLMNEARKDKRLAELEEMAQKNGIEVCKISMNELNEIGNGVKHQGVVILCSSPPFLNRSKKITEWCKSLGHNPLIVVLDCIQDPRNLGACIRSANSAGAGVIVPKRKGSPITDTVSRTAAGAVESTSIYESTNLARDLDLLKTSGFWVIGLDSQAQQSIYTVDLLDPCVLVFGSEDKGLRQQTKNKCDMLVSIPLIGTVESLNVSVSVGVAAFETIRQRSEKQ